jgi:hypothetical protein
MQGNSSAGVVITHIGDWKSLGGHHCGPATAELHATAQSTGPGESEPGRRMGVAPACRNVNTAG